MKKSYSLPVYRKIAEGKLKETNVSCSDLYLEVVKDKQNISVNQNYATTIFNINRDKKLTIYSNTLNIKVTDKYYKTTPLFKYIEVNTTDKLKALSVVTHLCGEEYLLEEDVEKDLFVFYLNSDFTFLSDWVVHSTHLINSSIVHSETVKIRRLKDRFKIEVSEIDSKKSTVVLGSQFLFEPKVHANHIEFYECVFKDNDNKILFLYNHSFNFLNKQELQKNEVASLLKIKDPVRTDNLIIKEQGVKYTKFEYSTWRSNLLYDKRINSDLYFYLNLDYTNKTDLIVQSVAKLEGQVAIYSLTNRAKDYEVEVNPYLRNHLETPLGENYSLLFEDNIENKYNKVDDIKIGTRRVILSKQDAITNRSIYLEDSGVKIYQEVLVTRLPSKEIPVISTETVTLPNYLIDNMDTLANSIYNTINNDNCNFQSDNIKRYDKEGQQNEG